VLVGGWVERCWVLGRLWGGGWGLRGRGGVLLLGGWGQGGSKGDCVVFGCDVRFGGCGLVVRAWGGMAVWGSLELGGGGGCLVEDGVRGGGVILWKWGGGGG